MKTLRDKETASKASELYEIIKKRQELEKREKELKGWFKELAGDDNAVRAGKWLVVLGERTKSVLDREALELLLGSLEAYELTSTYRMVEVRPTGLSVPPRPVAEPDASLGL